MVPGASRRDPDAAEAATQLRTYEGALRSYFARRVDSAAEVDDLTQETLARMLASSPASGMQNPIAYLFRIAANLLADRGRGGNRIQRRALPLTDDDLVAIPPDQEHARRHADLRAAYSAALDELPPRCRRAFVLRRHEEATTPEIAAELGISHRMVQKYLSQALAHLHARLRHFVEG